MFHYNQKPGSSISERQIWGFPEIFDTFPENLKNVSPSINTDTGIQMSFYLLRNVLFGQTHSDVCSTERNQESCIMFKNL